MVQGPLVPETWSSGVGDDSSGALSPSCSESFAHSVSFSWAVRSLHVHSALNVILLLRYSENEIGLLDVDHLVSCVLFGIQI